MVENGSLKRPEYDYTELAKDARQLIKLVDLKDHLKDKETFMIPTLQLGSLGVIKTRNLYLD